MQDDNILTALVVIFSGMMGQKAFLSAHFFLDPCN